MSAALEPTETTETTIRVLKFKQTRETESVSSISEAIDVVKNTDSFTTTKIELNGEIVYFSEHHESIEQWEQEWKRQKRKQAVDEPTRDCPFNVTGCYEDDLCIDCKMEKAAGNLPETQ